MASLQGTLRKAGVDVGHIYRQSHQEWSSDKQLSMERRNTSLLRPKDG